MIEELRPHNASQSVPPYRLGYMEYALAICCAGIAMYVVLQGIASLIAMTFL